MARCRWPPLGVQLSLSRRKVRLDRQVSPAMRRQIFYAGLLTEVEPAKEVRLFGLGAFLHDRLLGEIRAVNHQEQAMERRALPGHGLPALLGAAIGGGGLIWASVGLADSFAHVVVHGEQVAAPAGDEPSRHRAGVLQLVTVRRKQRLRHEQRSRARLLRPALSGRRSGEGRGASCPSACAGRWRVDLLEDHSNRR
ncbi:hypothetical protein AB0L05_03525 [Nonomuraea pusilla]|uniref:hypothetical protein n=1 Tax=Nonomuraea pusilla TaxID=46177 RepID=UPI00331E66C5